MDAYDKCGIVKNKTTKEQRKKSLICPLRSITGNLEIACREDVVGDYAQRGTGLHCDVDGVYAEPGRVNE